MKDAVFVADVSHKFQGSTKLYLTEDGYVVASSANNWLGPATLVFRSDGAGNVTDWRSIGVAYPSGEFAKALADAGYIVEGEG